VRLFGYYNFPTHFPSFLINDFMFGLQWVKFSFIFLNPTRSGYTNSKLTTRIMSWSFAIWICLKLLVRSWNIHQKLKMGNQNQCTGSVLPSTAMSDLRPSTTGTHHNLPSNIYSNTLCSWRSWHRGRHPHRLGIEIERSIEPQSTPKRTKVGLRWITTHSYHATTPHGK